MDRKTLYEKIYNDGHGFCEQHCTILHRLCDNGGDCPSCEVAVLFVLTEEAEAKKVQI